ncbi:RNA-directed DNA polymerase, eukaryota, reverse transcriptase zinc-binding domain protein [Tanacetum coccineum]|uniref:RNA-directed DNA polymerase, eukaryota, reverse transcriptase zinc-binding domain protein n=1 Tax=Tanacetum coccineum TaxID=301880 RepID=A0ABQ5FTE2_9ASTR
MAHHHSFEDDANKISTSIFVTNFPDQFYAKDLWKACNQYGNVVDAFISHRRSKSGKRFGFVRFIRVFDVDRLVNNLCTIWVDHFKLHANKARFQRAPLNNNKAHDTDKGMNKSVPHVVDKESEAHGHSKHYINAVKKEARPQNTVEESKSSLVLDDTCLNQEDFSKSLIGKVKDFSSLTNLKVALDNEGFDNIKLKYMGGYWVMIDFQTVDSKEKFKATAGTGSWFSELQQASSSFHIDERVTWVDIEGIPLKDETCYHSKRIYIKTKIVENIFESFKIIIKGKIFWVRAKEVSGWIPDFTDEEEEENDSDGDVKDDELDDENQDKENGGSCSNVSMKYPPGFTPMATNEVQYEVEKEGDECSQNVQDETMLSGVRKKRRFYDSTYGRLGEGLAQKAKKDWVKELSVNNKVNFLSLQETKMEDIEMFNIKACWGNFTFDYTYSPSVGFSGGILCVWDPKVFSKTNSTVSDYFVIVKGVWIPNGKKLLIISVYAPQELSEKRMVWDYLIVVINNWNGDVVIMGDFNEVRTQAERYGFVFNNQGAEAFNLFIATAGLEEIPLGGCNPDVINKRDTICKSLQDIGKLDSMEVAQKVKIKWAIEGDENSKYYHGILNKRRSQLAIRGILADGTWIDSPSLVKSKQYQIIDMESDTNRDEIKRAIWDCGTDKSPGPDGFTLGFFRRYWNFVEKDVV